MPEKHVTAIHIKNTKSDIIARKALKQINTISALYCLRSHDNDVICNSIKSQAKSRMMLV